MILCLQLMIGEGLSYLLTTAENELGVVVATSDAGSWTWRSVLLSLNLCVDACRFLHGARQLVRNAMSSNDAQGTAESRQGTTTVHPNAQQMIVINLFSLHFVFHSKCIISMFVCFCAFYFSQDMQNIIYSFRLSPSTNRAIK